MGAMSSCQAMVQKLLEKMIFQHFHANKEVDLRPIEAPKADLVDFVPEGDPEPSIFEFSFFFAFSPILLVVLEDYGVVAMSSGQIQALVQNLLEKMIF